jgi:hypothetical protein
LTFSSAERRRANYVGHLERAPDGETWVGHLADPAGDMILIEGRVEDFGKKKRLVLLAKHGLTPEMKKIRREEKQQ